MRPFDLVHDRTRSLWIGTNGGHVFVYSISGVESPSSNQVSIAADQTNVCSLAKEIRLKHKAPVLSIAVLDNANQSIGQGSAIPSQGSSTLPCKDSTGTAGSLEHANAHRVLICSEEQFKVKVHSRTGFPPVEHRIDIHITTPETGVQIQVDGHRRHPRAEDQHQSVHSENRCVPFDTLPAIIDRLVLDNAAESHSESCLVCLDNMGQLSIYALPSLRRQAIFNCVKPTDITGLSSFQFTPYAHAFYLQSSSEFGEVSFSPQNVLPYSMSISYDKLQRKTILRAVEDRSRKEANVVHEHIAAETPSKASVSSAASPAQSIEVSEPHCPARPGMSPSLRRTRPSPKNLYQSQQ